MKIPTKFAKYMLCPATLIIHLEEAYETLDNKVVNFEPVAMWFGETESNLKALEYNCRTCFGTSFAMVKSIWQSRLKDIGCNWCLYKMHEV